MTRTSIVVWRCVIVLCILLMSDSLAANADLKLRIMECESGFRHDIWGDDKMSYGIVQFREETFYEFSAKAERKMRRAKMWPPRWKNPQHQIFLLDWGLDNGYAKRWTCYRKAK